ncbi:Lrp/AsnC family transcriptional regulator [Candidatus Woesearchaeota archaeon]|nr:Lrp/AsnC family transcriptional regulator [Candidatus Woesearchaeota archaeon]
MNKKDLKIISHLRSDARMSLTNLSRKTSIPVTTIFDRIKVQQKDKVIKKFTSLLNFNELGYNTRANIALRVDREDKEELKEHLIKHENVNSVSRINNGYDFMVEGIFKQMVDLEDFLDKLEQRFKILDKKSFFIIEDLKKEDFMNDQSLMLEA